MEKIAKEQAYELGKLAALSNAGLMEKDAVVGGVLTGLKSLGQGLMSGAKAFGSGAKTFGKGVMEYGKGLYGSKILPRMGMTPSTAGTMLTRGAGNIRSGLQAMKPGLMYGGGAAGILGTGYGVGRMSQSQPTKEEQLRQMLQQYMPRG